MLRVLETRTDRAKDNRMRAVTVTLLLMLMK